jgi:hypothetical protein
MIVKRRNNAMAYSRSAVLFVLLLAGSAGLQCASWQTVQGDPELEEYAVYAAVISQVYVEPQTKVVVISSSTSSRVDPFSDFVFTRLSSLSRTTIGDFKAKEKEPYVLKPLFQLSVPVVLLSEEARRDIFQNRAERPAGADEADWQRFYERYSHSPGILYFTRVGMNPQRTQALVRVGLSWGASCFGPRNPCWHSQYILLTKQRGTWTVVQRESPPHAFF